MINDVVSCRYLFRCRYVNSYNVDIEIDVDIQIYVDIQIDVDINIDVDIYIDVDIQIHVDRDGWTQTPKLLISYIYKQCIRYLNKYHVILLYCYHGALCVPAKIFELRILFPPPCGSVRCGRGRAVAGPTLGLRCPGLGWAGLGQWPP